MRRLPAVLLALAGCAGAGEGRPRPGAKAARPPKVFAPAGQKGADPAGHHVVMVIDDGFDTSHPVFSGKVVDSYTLQCGDQGSPADNVDDTLPFDQQKAAYISAYGQVDTSCAVNEGITLTLAADYDDVLPEKDHWNAEVDAHAFTDSDAVVDQIQGVIEGDDDNLIYHGTSTAGLVAYQNPDVRLVLVEEELEAPDAPAVDSTADCPTQDLIDDFVKVHQDQDVANAYIQQPLAQSDQQLLNLVGQDKVTMINLSLGDDPRPVLEQELQQEGCGNLDYTAYFTVQGNLDLQKEQYRYAHGVYAGKRALSVQAGGNESTQVDDLGTAVQCSAQDVDQLIVGAVDLTGKRTDFTNYGKCIDLYTLGQGVVVALPDGFVDVEDGTSFSTPLTVRYATLKFPATDQAPALIKEIMATVDANGNLPQDAYPAELAFDDASAKISAYTFLDGFRRRKLERPHVLRRRLEQAIRDGGGRPTGG